MNLILFVMLGLGITGGTVLAESVDDVRTAVEKDYVVTAVDNGSKWSLEVVNQSIGSTRLIDLGPLVVDVSKVYAKGDRAFVVENLGKNAFAIEGFSLVNGDRLFNVLGRQITPSPDENWVAYESLYPVYAIESQIWPTINILNVTAPEPAEVVAFPPGGYRVSSEDDLIRKWFIVSPIIFSGDSTSFAVLERFGFSSDLQASELHLLVIGNIGKALTHKSVRLDIEIVEQMSPENLMTFWDSLSLEIVEDTFRVHYAGPSGESMLLTERPFSWKEGSN